MSDGSTPGTPGPPGDSGTPGHPGEWQVTRQAEWKSRASTSLVSIPYVALVVFWIGFLIFSNSWAGLTWLTVMWIACLLLVPMSIVGGVWGLRAGSRATLVWGLIAAVLCLPGFVLAFPVLGSILSLWWR
ncbi:hypothetical protein MUN76_09705 [Leucobacter rhizosphaerae]|uniref:Uncharacterized protein n=1 Tax=Leucobacter rhizosphaerae TaxID=2932245 RepID=A0ABY4FST6_9MICO|nr:hypothetical protein [Leucobacter rhizosphaerae]UOQ59333.1 hypothetical protein MUN76_09705 [Leucobacter rhizosphaerae]